MPARPAVSRTAAVPVLVAVLTLATFSLAGCAEDDSLSLVETKSPVQLLRNEAWYRLPEFIVKSASETTDVSVACSADGMERSWTSSTVALVNNSFAPRTEGVLDEVVATFTDQGWVAEEAAVAEGRASVLTRPDSIATITIHAVPKTSEHRASIALTTTGPCVATDGPDSDEVRLLESRG